jgi:predicted ABC-type ATPase
VIEFQSIDERPVIVAIAGSNGAGKSTFYNAHIKPAGLRFINADILGFGLGLEPYAAVRMADALRRQMVASRESFAFETVFSDPVGEKVRFLEQAAELGYNVILCFIGIASPDISEHRVAMRVTQGGHDVPTEKLQSRFPRTLENLKRAIIALPRVLIFDNSDLRYPYRKIAAFEHGQSIDLVQPVPDWFQFVLSNES